MVRRHQDKGKQEIIKNLIQAYDIKDAKDLQNALKNLLGSTLESMLESEMNKHLGYKKMFTSVNYWQCNIESCFSFKKCS